jgi:heme-degrading monooxygenase HmoA
MYARVNRFEEHTDDFDKANRIAEEELIPQLQAVPGFVGMQQLTDRDRRQSLVITFWETEEAMRDSEAEADRLRAEAKDRTGSDIQTVERYEVTLRVGF